MSPTVLSPLVEGKSNGNIFVEERDSIYKSHAQTFLECGLKVHEMREDDICQGAAGLRFTVVAPLFLKEQIVTGNLDLQ